MTRFAALQQFSDRDLIEELIERRLVIEAWTTTRISDLDSEMMKFDWRKMVDETNVQQLVNCEPFRENLRRKETADENSTVVTHTLWLIKSSSEATHDIFR